MGHRGRVSSNGSYVSAPVWLPLNRSIHVLAAFFGVIDLLGILPYYIEIALQQDTVSNLAIVLHRPRYQLLPVNPLQVHHPAYF